jgi:hypothetical protein
MLLPIILCRMKVHHHFVTSYMNFNISFILYPNINDKFNTFIVSNLWPLLYDIRWYIFEVTQSGTFGMRKGNRGMISKQFTNEG